MAERDAGSDRAGEDAVRRPRDSACPRPAGSCSPFSSWWRWSSTSTHLDLAEGAILFAVVVALVALVPRAFAGAARAGGRRRARRPGLAGDRRQALRRGAARSLHRPRPARHRPLRQPPRRQRLRRSGRAIRSPSGSAFPTSSPPSTASPRAARPSRSSSPSACRPSAGSPPGSRGSTMARRTGNFVALVLDDLTEQKRVDRIRVDFVANASHELRTPLASLVGFIETLQGPARDDAAGARALPQDHARPGDPHEPADRRSPVAVADRDEGACPPVGRGRPRRRPSGTSPTRSSRCRASSA